MQVAGKRDNSDAPPALRSAVAHGLPCRAEPVGPPSELTHVDLSFSKRHRVQGLVWKAIEDGAVIAVEPVVDAARDAATAALRTCLLAESNAAQALEALAVAGVEARVLKGVAIAHLDHDHPEERSFGDVDLLIRRDDHRRALDALQGVGFRRHEPPVRDWWERRFGKAIVLHAREGGELDLHLAITGGYFGARIDHDDLCSRPSEPFDLAGLTARGLDREGRLLNACCHMVLGGGSGLRAERDVAQLTLVSGADWQLVVDRAERNGIDLVLAEAASQVWDDLDLDPTHGFAVWARETLAAPDTTQARAIAGYRAARTEGWAPEGRTVPGALGPIDRVLYVAGLAWPSRASLKARGRTRRDHLARSLRSLRRR